MTIGEFRIFPLEPAPGPAHFVSRHESSSLPTLLSRRRATRGAGDRLVVAGRLAMVTRIDRCARAA